MQSGDIIRPMCEEMFTLRQLLDNLNIEWHDESDPITEERVVFGHCYIHRTQFWHKGDRYSVVYGYGTYGGWSRLHDDLKLLELMINGEEPTGYHTADDIIRIMKERSKSL